MLCTLPNSLTVQGVKTHRQRENRLRFRPFEALSYISDKIYVKSGIQKTIVRGSSESFQTHLRSHNEPVNPSTNPPFTRHRARRSFLPEKTIRPQQKNGDSVFLTCQNNCTGMAAFCQAKHRTRFYRPFLNCLENFEMSLLRSLFTRRYPVLSSANRASRII